MYLKQGLVIESVREGGSRGGGVYNPRFPNTPSIPKVPYVPTAPHALFSWQQQESFLVTRNWLLGSCHL